VLEDNEDHVDLSAFKELQVNKELGVDQVTTARRDLMLSFTNSFLPSTLKKKQFRHVQMVLINSGMDTHFFSLKVTKDLMFKILEKLVLA